jgi:hypothetical protein
MYLDDFLALYPYTVWCLGNDGNNNNLSVTGITGKQYDSVWETKTNLGYVTLYEYLRLLIQRNKDVCVLSIFTLSPKRLDIFAQ